MKALAIAATGMNAQQLNLDVIANNIANINTTGYKRARAEFSDLLYLAERPKAVRAASGDGIVPEGAHVGLGVKPTAVRHMHQQGTLDATGNKLDLALQGPGWLNVEGPGGETLFTRAGALNTNAEGEIVTPDGLRILPALTVPENATDIIVGRDGTVSVRLAGQDAPNELGRLRLSTFANEAGLDRLGDNLARPTVASGDPVDGAAGEVGFATVLQGYLEDSNVDPVREISDLITAQRAYEMNSKVVQAADEMMSVVARMR